MHIIWSMLYTIGPPIVYHILPNITNTMLIIVTRPPTYIRSHYRDNRNPANVLTGSQGHFAIIVSFYLNFNNIY